MNIAKDLSFAIGSYLQQILLCLKNIRKSYHFIGSLRGPLKLYISMKPRLSKVVKTQNLAKYTV